MVIATGDGQVYKDEFERLSAPFLSSQVAEGGGLPNPFEDVGKYTPKPLTKPQEPSPALKFWEHPSPKKVIPIREGENEGREEPPLYRGGKDVAPKTPPEPNPTRPIKIGSIDNEHHVPLIASGILDDQGNMSGLAIDHRVKVPNEYLPHLALHEATEIPLMHDYMADGMIAQDAYHKAHDIATAVESASVRGHAARNGLDPDKYQDDYKQFFRDAGQVAGEPSGRDRHERAHTSVHHLDEAEGAYKVAGDVVEFPQKEQHPPLKIDVLGQGTAMHSGPGPFKRPDKNVGKSKPANENKQETDYDAMVKLARENPDLYKYYRAMFEQKGGENWERWQNLEEELYFMGHGPEFHKERMRNELNVIPGGKENE